MRKQCSDKTIFSYALTNSAYYGFFCFVIGTVFATAIHFLPWIYYSLPLPVLIALLTFCGVFIGLMRGLGIGFAKKNSGRMKNIVYAIFGFLSGAILVGTILLLGGLDKISSYFDLVIIFSFGTLFLGLLFIQLARAQEKETRIYLKDFNST